MRFNHHDIKISHDTNINEKTATERPVSFYICESEAAYKADLQEHLPGRIPCLDQESRVHDCSEDCQPAFQG